MIVWISFVHTNDFSGLIRSVYALQKTQSNPDQSCLPSQGTPDLQQTYRHGAACGGYKSRNGGKNNDVHYGYEIYSNSAPVRQITDENHPHQPGP